jgi:hypothetical protein
MCGSRNQITEGFTGSRSRLDYSMTSGGKTLNNCLNHMLLSKALGPIKCINCLLQ